MHMGLLKMAPDLRTPAGREWAIRLSLCAVAVRRCAAAHDARALPSRLDLAEVPRCSYRFGHHPARR